MGVIEGTEGKDEGGGGEGGENMSDCGGSEGLEKSRHKLRQGGILFAC